MGDGLGSRLLSAGRLALSDESLDLMVSWNSVKIDADPRRRQRHRQSAVFTISFGGAPSRSAQDACVRGVTEADPEFFDASVRTLVRGVEDIPRIPCGAGAAAYNSPVHSGVSRA